jgi:hypothetical protein
MPRNDDSLERLRAAIDQLAATDAADLLNEARIEARARVRATLADALAHSMLERLHEQLPDPVRDTAPPRQERPVSAQTRDEPATRRNSVRSAPDDAEPRPGPTDADPPDDAEPRPAPTDAEPHPTPPSDEPAWYVYGVIGGDTELDGSLVGVDPAHAVTTLREGALAAVASLVPLEEFDEVQLREHLGDMSWVEATARAHEAVLEAIRDQTTVIPMRMCTVYRSESGIREMLTREADPLRDALDRLDGKAEWGVKVFTSGAAADADADASASPSSHDSPGAAYMERRRTDRERRQRALQVAQEAADLIHERLSAVASNAQVIPLQRPEVTGHSGDMILNGVYLVPDDAAEAFHEEVRALASELGPHGIELNPTGPWPAYNFVPGTIGAAW